MNLLKGMLLGLFITSVFTIALLLRLAVPTVVFYLMLKLFGVI